MNEGPFLGTSELDYIGLTATGCFQQLGWEGGGVGRDLDRGNWKFYLKGYRLKATLSWTSNALLEESMAAALNNLFNQSCETALYYSPYPAIHTGSFYQVIWKNNWEFYYVRGLENVGYSGKIELVGKEILTEKPYFL